MEDGGEDKWTRCRRQTEAEGALKGRKWTCWSRDSSYRYRRVDPAPAQKLRALPRNRWQTRWARGIGISLPEQGGGRDREEGSDAEKGRGGVVATQPMRGGDAGHGKGVTQEGRGISGGGTQTRERNVRDARVYSF
jgi:hypothetical protein